MRILSLLAVLILSLSFVAVGCEGEKKETKEEKKDEGPKLDDGQQFALESGTKDLAEARQELEKGENPHITCAGMMTYADDLKGTGVPEAEAFAKDAAQLCNHDAPLKIAAAEAEKAETARAADPDGVISECYNAEFETSIKTLDEAGFGEEEAVKAAKDRFAKACPK